MLLLTIAGAAFVATLAGGLFALSLKDNLHLVLGFTAGAVIGVAFFDLLPEAIALGKGIHTPGTLLACSALGFLLYLALDRAILLHGHSTPLHDGDGHATVKERGTLGAVSLSIHSFLDGLAIGLAFHASRSVGIVVAIAVLTHDFSDGINTLNLVLKNGGSRHKALAWLFVDAAAPVVGVATTFFVVLPAGHLGLVLAIFAGFFLYIGASELIPESYHAHPKALTTLMTFLGAAVLYATVRLAA